MIESDAYMHFKNKKLKKTDKLSTCFKKMILIEYKNHSIYCLYNRESNLIFVLCSVDVNKSSMLKKLTTAEAYEIKPSTAESNKPSTAEPAKFGESFTSESHETESSPINKPIFKHVALPVKNKYKSEDKMSSSSSQTEVLKIRHERFSTKKKNIMNSTVMSVMMMK